MQNRNNTTQEKKLPKINQCPACGLMSFPSQGGVFAAKTTEKPTATPNESSNSLNPSDSNFDHDDLRHSIIK